MKTLKFLVVLCIIIGFDTNAVNAQPVRNSYTIEYVSQQFPCIAETVTGSLVVQEADLNGRYHALITGTFMGDIFGFHYSFRGVANEDDLPIPVAFVDHNQIIMLMRKEGKLMGRYRLSYHVTINANGDLTANFDESEWICD
jgi:hypothetical protein